MVNPAPKEEDSAQLKGSDKTRRSLNPQQRNTHAQDKFCDLKIYHQNIQGLKGKLDQL